VESGTDALNNFDDAGKAVAVDRGAKLGRPNGIAVDSSGVIVVSYGSGEIYRLDANTGARTDLPRPPKGQLDGVERLADGSLIMSSWEGSAVYRFTAGSYTTAIDSVTTPADIGYDSRRNAVLIPEMMKNQVGIRGLK
jgi:sugar lactone lactonase YvrE